MVMLMVVLLLVLACQQSDARGMMDGWLATAEGGLEMLLTGIFRLKSVL